MRAKRGATARISRSPLKQPAEKIVRLNGAALFPSQHLQAILDAAQAERKFLSVDIYEGAGTGEASDEAAAAIGVGASLEKEGPLRGGVRHWPVSVGYFDGGSGEWASWARNCRPTR